MQVQRYRGLPALGSLRLGGDQDYLDAFLELFQRAVRVRLRTEAPIAATLSGGLDSGSVVALAAPMLAQQGRPLLALTSVPQFEPSLAGTRRTGDEWALAERTAHRAGPNVDHVPVRAEGRSFLGSLDRLLAIHHAPGQASGNYYWIDAILEEASRRGCRVVLTGALGNGGVSWQGSGSVALRLLQGQFSGALATLRHNAGNPWAVLKRQIIKPLALPLLRMKRYYLGGRENLWVTQSAINPGFAARLGIARRLRQAGFEPTGTPSCLEDVRPLLFGTVTQVGCDMWHELASAHGLDVRDPTADLELMEFCLKVPDEQYVRQGKGRLLLRRAMAGRLPGEVLDNEAKGLQGADLEARILQEQRAVAEVLKRMEASEACCACLDLGRMETLLASLHKGSVSMDKWRSMGALCRGLAAGKFLLNFY
jgi:asparagine synthase (glutamine-hydrolysing)